MKIALFSDVHGRLRIVLHLLRYWQIVNNEELDAALIAGDLGCFPEPDKFDKATRRWIERDPREAGFSTYFVRPKSDVQKYLEKKPESGPYSAVRCPILFTPGNHEDYEYLKVRSTLTNVANGPPGTFSVDCYQDNSSIKLVEESWLGKMRIKSWCHVMP